MSGTPSQPCLQLPRRNDTHEFGRARAQLMYGSRDGHPRIIVSPMVDGSNIQLLHPHALCTGWLFTRHSREMPFHRGVPPGPIRRSSGRTGHSNQETSMYDFCISTVNREKTLREGNRTSSLKNEQACICWRGRFSLICTTSNTMYRRHLFGSRSLVQVRLSQ